MDRRDVLKSVAAAAVTLPIGAISGIPTPPDDPVSYKGKLYPLIKFCGNDAIADAEQLFEGAEWVDTNYAGLLKRQCMAWLNREHGFLSPRKTHLIHGPVSVHQIRRSHWTSGTALIATRDSGLMIMRLPESLETPVSVKTTKICYSPYSPS